MIRSEAIKAALDSSRPAHSSNDDDQGIPVGIGTTADDDERW
jgi:hypothetical protein